MPVLIGMDEAGLGPNLGPFVVAVTVWEVPGSPGDFDFWTAFDMVLTNAPIAADTRLHVADSKQVFQPHRGLTALERGVWAALGLCKIDAPTFSDLCHALSKPLITSSDVSSSSKQLGLRANQHVATQKKSLFDDSELAAARSPTDTTITDDDRSPLPWYPNGGFPLPVESNDVNLVDSWRQACERLGVRLVAIRADVVEPLRFNRLVRHFDNKAQATSRLAMNLLKSVWHPNGDDALIVADKHGGRNRYDALLSETFQVPVESIAEGAEQSIYRVGRGELRFQPRAESHGPVALASMTAKYLRELAMHQFNDFWKARVPELKPTQGYPVDAKRFRDDIATEKRRLQIADEAIWRER